ncbi:KilA-N domain-containing protein [Anaerophaga thermohalophila]|uniref:KilA-N domain-containing protein n=1 Tax=Anaerophaga thermohalophila TaxID=177400 RepID=UPI0002E03025|nr:KilA-N domain-containing protein [Anaerophaga thermohalophila]
MAKNKILNVKGTEIKIFKGETDDYISLTDIARHKNAANTDSIIQNWLRNRNTIELLGFCEQMYNPDFKPLEFDGFGDFATLEQLVVLSNLESINAVLIRQNLFNSATPGAT